MNTTWRIIKWNDDKIYLISADTLDNKVNYVFDDRYNETVNSQKGYNTFESSRIYNSLESYYRNNLKIMKNIYKQWILVFIQEVKMIKIKQALSNVPKHLLVLFLFFHL